MLTKYNNQGGVVVHIVALANELVSLGHDVLVCAPLLANGDKGLYANLNCKFVAVNFSAKNPIYILKNIVCLVRLIDSGIDIIHSHNRITSVYAQIISMLTKVPYIWTMHSGIIPSDLFHRMCTFYGKKAICVSTDVKNFAIEKLKIPDKDIEVVLNGVDEKKYIRQCDKKINEIRKKLSLCNKDRVIVLLSRLDPKKGHLKAIDALSMCTKRKNIKIIFTGESSVSGYKEMLLKRISYFGMEDNFLFVGYVNPVDILSIADLSILPSDIEGFPYSVIESFLLKVPVIRTNTGGYYDVKDCCLLMNNTNDLAEYFDKFIDGQLDTAYMVRHAYEFAKTNCTCRVMTNKILDVYKQAMI